MKKSYEVPASQQIDMLVDEGILGLSKGIEANSQVEKEGSEAWSQKKNPIW